MMQHMQLLDVDPCLDQELHRSKFRVVRGGQHAIERAASWLLFEAMIAGVGGVFGTLTYLGHLIPNTKNLVDSIYTV
jgi:hypothetical protein